MAFKAIPLETRSCKGCGVEFQTTDPRKVFHKPSCYSKTIKVTNAWLLANRPNFPTEPCRNCGGPVVQYRTRRYDGEMSYCGRSCQPNPKANWHGPTKQELSAAKSWSSKCRHCGKRLHYGSTGCGSCYKKRRLALLRLHIRLRWLLPKQCTGCGESFNEFGSGWKCKDCKAESYRQWRHIRRLRIRGEGSYEPGISYTVLFRSGDGHCSLCRKPCDDPSVWANWDGLTWMPNAPTLDHIIALANGGTHTWGNVQLACADCNSHKGDRTHPRGSVILENERATVPSDEFVYLLYGVEPA
jgi:5-methylcytosine-specific restriction endonuclease McrA